jgi:hypothetical protein
MSLEEKFAVGNAIGTCFGRECGEEFDEVCGIQV